MHEASLTLTTPRDFDFWRSAYSHGWCDLAPFDHDAERHDLRRLFALSDGSLVFCTMNGARNTLRCRTISAVPLGRERTAELTAQMRTCLRLDEDFGSFHAAARRHPHFRWIAAAHAGRMLRAPTVFEDTVKMICTTNCTWALTKLMVSNLVRRAGQVFDDTHFSFPGPAAVAALSERELRAHVKAGYRAPYIRELAQRVTSGELAIEAWRTSTAPTEVLYDEIRSVKGVGPYAAGNLLKLLGHYDRLGLDSWVRGQYYRLHRKGRKVKDATIEKAYERYGAWRGLFFWLEMTRYWHDQKFTV